MAPPRWTVDAAGICVYFGVSMLVFHLCEGWPALEALYFCVVALTTVGYGDVTPHTAEGKLYSMLYITVGLMYVGTKLNAGAAMLWASIEEASNADRGPSSVDVDRVRTEAWAKVCASSVLAIAVLLIGTLVTMSTEGWSFLDAFYWSFITTTTVGFGDETPSNTSTKWFAIFYILGSTAAIAVAIGRILAAAGRVRHETRRAATIERALDPEWLAEMDTDGDGVDKTEFLVAILVQLGHVTANDVEPWLHRFDTLDADGSGRLDGADIRILVNGHLRPDPQQRRGGGSLAEPLMRRSTVAF